MVRLSEGEVSGVKQHTLACANEPRKIRSAPGLDDTQGRAASGGSPRGRLQGQSLLEFAKGVKYGRGWTALDAALRQKGLHIY